MRPVPQMGTGSKHKAYRPLIGVAVESAARNSCVIQLRNLLGRVTTKRVMREEGQDYETSQSKVTSQIAKLCFYFSIT